jgi:TP901 family phage tail tape measure protein
MIGGAAQKITVEIGGKLGASLTSSLKAAQQQVSGFSRNVSRTFNDAALAGRNAFQGVVRNPMWQAGAVAAAGIGAGLVSATRVAIEFEKQMSSVAAKMGDATEEQLTQLGNLAKELGRTTKFTASETAAAMDFLAMAGFKTNEILSATPGVLNLAAVGNMELAEAADVASNILGGMGMEVAKTDRLIDVLAKTATSGNTSVSQLGEAFKSVGPTARSAGASIEDVGASLAILGDRGIQGEEAGTALRNVFVRLAAPPSEAAKALQRLGVSTKDAAGNMRPFESILGDVDRRMKDMNLGTAEQLQLQSDIFGLRALAAGQILQEASATGELADRVKTVTDSQGAAATMAQKMGDNLGGALTRLGSAAEGFQLALAGPNSKVLQGLVDGLAGMIGKVTELMEAFPELSGAVVIAGGAFVGLIAIAPFLASFIAVVKTLGAAVAAMKLGAVIAGWAGAAGPALAAIKVGLVALTGPIGLTIAAIVGIGAALVWAYRNVEWFRNGVNAIWKSIQQVFQGFMNYLGGAWKVFTGILMGDADRAKEGVAQAFGGLRQIFGTIIEGIKTVWSGFTSFIGDLVQQVVGFFQQMAPAILAVMFPVPTLILGVFGKLPPGVQGIFNQVVAFIRSVPGMLADVGAKIIDTIINGIKSRATALKDTVRETFAGVRNLMPFSDAKEGPFSELTASGKAIVGTLAYGIADAAPVMRRAFASAADDTMRALAAATMTPAFASAADDTMRALAAATMTPAFASVPAPAPAAAGGRGGGAITFSPRVEINVSNSASSADDIADRVRLALRDMLSDAESSMRAFLND